MKRSLDHGSRITVILSGMTLSCLWLLSSCISMAPVNSTFESAKTLNPGQVEITGNYSSYTMKTEDEECEEKFSEKVNDNYGFRIGYGVVDRFDIKLRYERLKPALQEDKDVLDAVNFISFTPRYSIIKDKLTSAIDFDYYQARLNGDESQYEVISISPRIAFSSTPLKYFDFTLGTGLDILTGDFGTYWGWNLGCGFSSDLEQWALRPEVGLMFDTSDLGYGPVLYTWGLALVMKFNTWNKVSKQ